MSAPDSWIARQGEVVRRQYPSTLTREGRALRRHLWRMSRIRQGRGFIFWSGRSGGRRVHLRRHGGDVLVGFRLQRRSAVVVIEGAANLPLDALRWAVAEKLRGYP